jgi:hypothetical protein
VRRRALSYKRIHDLETQITEPHASIDGKLVPIGWDRRAS